MKILQLTPRMPFPLTDGGNIGIYNITKHLAKLGHEVTLVTFPLESKDTTQQAVADLGRYADVHMVSHPLPARWKVFAKAFFRGAYPIERRMTPEMFDLLRSLVNDREYDIVHVDHAHMGRYGLWLREEFGLPIVLREHNYESLIYERFAKSEKNPIKSLLARIHGKRLSIEETKFLREYDAVAAISDADASLMRAVAPEARISVIPAGADTDYFRRSSIEPDPDTILSVGTLAWDPNFDSLRYFLAEIFPLILKSRPQARLEVVGASPERISPFAKAFGSSVVLHGQVPDVRDYLARAAVVVVPLRIGGGMRVKLLEFFAAGKAIVSTSIGAEGNRAEDEVHLLIRDRPGEFAEALLRVLAEPEIRKALGERARELAVSSYGWQHIARSFGGLYEQVLSAYRLEEHHA